MIQKDVLLSGKTTFGIGGFAKYYCEVSTKEELLEVLEFGSKEKLPLLILGGGSNVLINDDGFSGLVIKVADKKVDIKENVFVEAGAAVLWDDLVRLCIEKDLQGIECMSGIPGSVGATPVQNIGAYGQELSEVFVNLTAYDTQKSCFVELNKKECEFAYRDSIFKRQVNKNRFIIWSVKLKLKKHGKPNITYESLKTHLSYRKVLKPTLMQVRDFVLELRKERHIDPKINGNAGSFFKNPIVTKRKLEKILKKHSDLQYFESGEGKYKLFAGWLIEKAGFRGREYRHVAVSPKHALVLINKDGKGKASEVVALAEEIIKDVEKKFYVTLELEVNII